MKNQGQLLFLIQCQSTCLLHSELLDLGLYPLNATALQTGIS